MIAPTRLAQAAMALGLAALAGCATFGAGLMRPTVNVVAVRLDRIESFNAYFVAAVTLDNPNARAITVDSIEATLSIEDEPVATAQLVAPVSVPANGTASAEIAARSGMDAILRAVASAMRRLGTAGAPSTASPALRYSIEGTARLAGGLRAPFRRSGELGSRPSRGAP